MAHQSTPHPDRSLNVLPLIAIATFIVNITVRDGSILGSIALAILIAIATGIVLTATHRPRTHAARRPRHAKPAPSVAEGDIGPAVKGALERGDYAAATRCITEGVPWNWEARRDLIALVEEHGLLQRSMRIAGMAGVPVPDEAADVAAAQIDLIADRARRMAFVCQHGTMNPRIEASLTRLADGARSVSAQSAQLRVDLAESTGQSQWGAQEERELLRKLERMSNTLQALRTDSFADEFRQLEPSPQAAGELSPNATESDVELEESADHGSTGNERVLSR